MPTVYSAAIDLGATSGRVILGAWSNNRLSLQEVHRFPNTFRSLGPHDYWDVAGLWAEVRAGLLKAAAALPRRARLASVGVDTWGVDYALVNDAGRRVLKGADKVTLRKDTLKPATRKTARAAGNAAALADGAAGDTELFEALRQRGFEGAV